MRQARRTWSVSRGRFMCWRRCREGRKQSSEVASAVKRERHPNIIDRSVKALIRRVPSAFFRLAEVDVDPAAVRPGDVAVNLPEFRADQVFTVGSEDDPRRWAIHLEYQLQPDQRVLKGWLLKNFALSVQLDIPVI